MAVVMDLCGNVTGNQVIEGIMVVHLIAVASFIGHIIGDIVLADLAVGRSIGH